MLEESENRNKSLIEENLNLRKENDLLMRKLKKLTEDILSKQLKMSICESACTNDTLNTEINPNISFKFSTNNSLIRTSIFEAKSQATAAKSKSSGKNIFN